MTRFHTEPSSPGPIIPMPQWTDQQLVAQLKWELTHGMAKEVGESMMTMTKAWRQKVWLLALEFDRRATPKPGAHRR